MRVGDLLEEFKEKPCNGQKPTVLTLTEKNGFIPQSERFNKRLALEDTSGYKLVRRDDIAFNPYLLWAAAIARNTVVEEGVISPLYPTFHVRSGFDPSYVGRLLLSPQLVGAYDGIAFGSVPRRRRSSVKDFLALPLPSQPSLEEQMRIAAILDKADSIRAKRRQVLDHLDALTQSIFHDMFGKASASAAALGDLVEGIENGTSPVCEARPAGDGEWGVLKLGAVTYGDFRSGENKALLEGGEELAQNEVRPGDVLMTRKNTRDLVGAVVLVEDVRPRLLIPDLIFRLTMRKDIIDPQYFQTLMMSPRQREQVRALSSGSAASMPNISKARLRKLKVVVPPMDQQIEFARRVRVISRRRNEIQRASELDDELFASLQARAFAGEL